MLILPGGQSWETDDNATAIAKAADFLAIGIPVAAMCAATFALTRAGFLDNRCTPACSRYLKASGYRGSALYRNIPAIADGNLVTAARRLATGYTLPMALQFTTSYLEDSLALFTYYKKLAERAIAQLTDDQLFLALDAESNSIAVIVKHVSGNMVSRWTDFLTTDGEKPSRDRDGEFEVPPATRAALLATWEAGWACLFGALEPLTDADLARTVTIRGEAHSVMQAINRQLAHYPHHIGQIVLLAKHFAHENWRSLSVPRKGSQEFNRRVTAGEASQR